MVWFYYKWKKYQLFRSINKFLTSKKEDGKNSILYVEINREFAYDIIGVLRNAYNSSEEKHYNYQKLKDLDKMRGQRSRNTYLEVELESLIRNLERAKKRYKMKKFIAGNREEEIPVMDTLDAVAQAVVTLSPTCSNKMVVIFITPYKERYPDWDLKDFRILTKDDMLTLLSTGQSVIEKEIRKSPSFTT